MSLECVFLWWTFSVSNPIITHNLSVGISRCEGMAVESFGRLTSLSMYRFERKLLWQLVIVKHSDRKLFLEGNADPEPAIPVLELHQTWLLKISLQHILFLSSPHPTFCQSPVGIVNLQRFPYLAIGKPCSKVKDPSYRWGILIWMLPFLDFTFLHFCWSSSHLLPLCSFKKQGKNFLK